MFFKSVSKRILKYDRKYSVVKLKSVVESQSTNGVRSEWDEAIPYEQVPGPESLPVIGNSWKIIPFIGTSNRFESHKSVEKLYNKYGPIVRVTGLLGRSDVVFLFDADDAKSVYTQEEIMPNRIPALALHYYTNVLRKDFYGDYPGLLTTKGEQWQNFRVKVQQPMLQRKISLQYIGALEDATLSLINKINQVKDEQDEVPDTFLSDLNSWALESVGHIALDTRLGCLDPNPSKYTKEVIQASLDVFQNLQYLEMSVPFWKYFNTPSFKKLASSLDTLKDITIQCIEKAKKNRELNGDSQGKSLLQRLLDINKDDPTVANVMALEMFTAGTDTSAMGLANTLYHLSMHQDAQDKLYQEIQTILPDKNDPLTADKLEAMKYLKAVIKEAMRLKPISLVNLRILSHDTIIRGYRIPKGVQIAFGHYVMGRSEKYFPSADQFIPERWLKQSSQPHTEGMNNQGCPEYHPFSFLPFGYGRRMCIGQRYANLGMQIATAKLVHSFKIEHHYGEMKYETVPMLKIKGPLKLRMIAREKHS